MNLDFDGPTDALPLIGAMTSAVAVLPPWVVVIAEPVEPTAPGHETAYSLLTAAAAAAVVLVAALADRIDERATVALPDGFVVALLVVARWVTLGDAQSAEVGVYVAMVGVYVAMVGGLVTAVGGAAARQAIRFSYLSAESSASRSLSSSSSTSSIQPSPKGSSLTSSGASNRFSFVDVTSPPTGA